MKKVELILSNFDARIPKIEIKHKNVDTKVVISSKMYDEETDDRIAVKIIFSNVAAIDFRINFFECAIGSESCGLYCIKDRNLVDSIVKNIYDR